MVTKKKVLEVKTSEEKDPVKELEIEFKPIVIESESVRFNWPGIRRMIIRFGKNFKRVPKVKIEEDPDIYRELLQSGIIKIKKSRWEKFSIWWVKHGF